jgi:hypothetical protein
VENAINYEESEIIEWYYNKGYVFSKSNIQNGILVSINPKIVEFFCKLRLIQVNQIDSVNTKEWRDWSKDVLSEEYFSEDF